MRESRLIIFISIVFSIAIAVIAAILKCFFPSLIDYCGILTNIYCGVVVSFGFAFGQYFMYKRKIVNNIYGLYFDIYRSYYYAKNRPFLFHYNALSFYKKLINLNPRICEVLDEYHGFFKRCDKTYMKLSPQIVLNNNYKMSKINKSLFYWFNKKYFDSSVEPYISEVVKILQSINFDRFNKDKEEMIKMFNYIYDIK